MIRFALLLLLLPLFAAAAPHDTLVIKKAWLSSDTQNVHAIGNGWRYYIGDDPAMAKADYDDNLWDTIDLPVRYRSFARTRTDTFSSLAWFRLHFVADSTITGLPLALWITHYGASEIYLDGHKIESFGRIRGPGNSEYFDPQNMGLVFTIREAGHHVLAVRYANYKAKENHERYGSSFSGFKVLLSEAKVAVISEQGLLNWAYTCAALFGLLLAFGLAHLFIFFYRRDVKAHIYFAIFCFCLSYVFLVFYLNRVSTDPGIVSSNVITSLIVVAFGCFSFSGLTNSLFSKSKTRFRIITVVSFIAPLVWIFSHIISALLFVFLALFVFMEATIVTTGAIRRKVKGARIVGSGILFFALFFLASTIFFSLHGDVNDGTTSGKIYLLLAAAAFLSIPFFMSLYLAWDYAHVNKGLKAQLLQVEKLSAQTLAQEQEKKMILEQQNELLETEVANRTAELVVQKKKSDDLLLNILPAEVADELKENGTAAARYFDHVTVLFTDFVNFTNAGEKMQPQELVNELHACFKAFDEIISGYGIEKIKTIGDAYMAVCGLPEQVSDHAARMAAAALDITAFMTRRKQELGERTFDIRIGLHSGSVVAGIVGVKKFAYDIWGDTVNTAARMEQNSEPGRVNISESTYELIKETFNCEYRGKIEAKNKGNLNMYFITRK